MSDPGEERKDVGAEYDRMLSLNEALLAEILFALQGRLREDGIKTHSIIGRVKEKKSYLEKIKRKSYVDPLSDMPDLVATRVVCLFYQDLPRIRDAINSLFVVDAEEDKIEQAPNDSFGYMSVHYECRLRDDYSGPRYDSLKGIKFEVQSRTLLMDAWANVSHYLAYKGEASIPDGMKRNFHALSGLFYVADQHFQMLYVESLHSERSARELVEAGGDDLQVDIDRGTVVALLRALYPDRDQSSQESVSEFVEEIAGVGYRKLGTLREALVAGNRTVHAYERDYPPGTVEHPEMYADLGMARSALAIADPNYASFKYEDAIEFFPYRQPNKPTSSD